MSYVVMDRTEYEMELETVLVNVLRQLQEDVPVDAWSKHLTSAVREAYDLLSGVNGDEVHSEDSGDTPA